MQAYTLLLAHHNMVRGQIPTIAIYIQPNLSHLPSAVHILLCKV